MCVGSSSWFEGWRCGGCRGVRCVPDDRGVHKIDDGKYVGIYLKYVDDELEKRVDHDISVVVGGLILQLARSASRRLSRSLIKRPTILLMPCWTQS